MRRERNGKRPRFFNKFSVYSDVRPPRQGRGKNKPYVQASKEIPPFSVLSP